MMFTTLTVLPWYTGMILAMAEFFAMHHVGVSLPSTGQFSFSPLDRHPRSIEQTDIHRERHCEPLLFRHYIRLDGLGGLLLGNPTATSYVPLYLVSARLSLGI